MTLYLADLASVLPGAPGQIFSGSPGVGTWVNNLPHLAFSKFIQSIFAYVEVFHLLGLFMLGGAVIVTCMRLMGLGITSEPASVVEKNTRVFLNVGVVMAIVTGLLMGMSNAGKLYGSEIFTVKMMAMVAGILFSYFVMIPVAKAEGAATPGARVAVTVAMVIWLIAMLTFSLRLTANVGVFHVMWACAVILFSALRGKLRWVFGAGLALIVVVSQIVTHVVITDAMDHDRYMAANRAILFIAGGWIFGMAIANIFGKAAAPGSSNFARMVGYATILVWVTVGAGGRWIGTS